MPPDAFSPAPRFVENAAARSGQYATLTVDVARVLASWRDSLLSYEWLRPDGTVKDASLLPPAQQTRSAAVEAALAGGAPLEMPVLGIGLQDNIEIGSGRAVFLTLARLGLRAMPVHVPRAHMQEFREYTA